MNSISKVVKPVYSTNALHTEAVGKTKSVSSKNTPKTPLRRVDELPPKYREIFHPNPTFNVVQSSVLDCLLATDSPVVVSAPTGSGKTVLFELAIVRLIETCSSESTNLGENKIVYLAPVKALCSERYSEWTNKFRSLGLRTAEVTGDSSDLVDLKTINNIDLILTTPEKWDSMTRRWRDHAGLLQLIKLFLIDEVHLLNEERRGPTLEAVVSRMKAVEQTLNRSGNRSQVRFVAVSATIPNISDVAQWLGTPECPATFYKFDESVRPVNLKKIVLGYPIRSKDKAFTFDLNLTYKLKLVIQTHANGKPTLIFCSSRKSVQQTCNTLKKMLSFNFTREQMDKLEEATSRITDNNLRELVKHGLAYHHAGLMVSDRQCLEEVFKTGFLPVLISTSTLAMGVNLPAHLVIIKSTEQYVCGEWQPYSESQILQMMGRAGRPQFDSTATAVIMTRDTNKAKYEKMVSGEELVESSLHNHLVEHLNSEIVLGTITDIAVAMNWLRSTFLYIRALRNPKHYGMQPNLTEREIESKLQAMCMRDLHALEKYELISTSNFAYSVSPTENGKLMARYYIAFDTMKVFMKIEGTETLPKLLELLTRCHEFQDVQLRRYERPILNSLNRNRGKESIRFPIPGKITTKTAKANVLIQAVLGSLQIPDAGLLQESVKVMRLAERLLRGLTLYLGRKPHFEAYASALTLHKCSVVKMWENSDFVSRQLPGIGPALGALLVSAGKRTFRDIVETDPRTIERIINRQPPMGNTLQEAAQRMPQYDIDIVINESSSTVLVHVVMLNPQEVQYGNLLHKFNLLLSVENKILKREIVSDQTLVLQKGNYTLQTYAGDAIKEASELTVTLISQSIVGVDVQAKLKPISDVGIQSPDYGISESANRPQTSALQTGNKNKLESNESTKSSGRLDKFSFQPSRSKKLIKDKTENSRPVVIDKNPARQPNFGNSGAQAFREVDEGRSELFDSNWEFDNPNVDVIEIVSSSSSGGTINSRKSTTKAKGIGINSRSTSHREAAVKIQPKAPQQVENIIVATIQSDIKQRPETDNSPEPDESKEDLGFDIDELFHSSSNENLPGSGGVAPEMTNVVPQRPAEDIASSTSEITESRVIPSMPLLTRQRLELPLCHSTANFDKAGRAPKDFTETDDRAPDVSEEDDLNDLFFGMSSEDLTCEILRFSPTNSRLYDHLTNTESEGFKFNEIPDKLRLGYVDTPTNTERFGWKPPNAEHQISQSTQEFISTQSVVSQMSTTQFCSSQLFVPYDGQQLCTQGRSAFARTIQGQDISSFPVQGPSSLVVDPDQSSQGDSSYDPRSLEYACRFGISSTAFSDPYAQDHPYAGSSEYVPYPTDRQRPQSYPVPPMRYPTESQGQTLMHYPLHSQSSQGFNVQWVNSKPDIYPDVYSPSFSSQNPLPHCTNQHSTPPECGSTPRTSRHPGVAKQPQNSVEKLVEVLQYTEGHTRLPQAPVFKRRRTSSGDPCDGDSGVGSSVCTSLSSLMAIHGGYSKSLNRKDI